VETRVEIKSRKGAESAKVNSCSVREDPDSAIDPVKLEDHWAAKDAPKNEHYRKTHAKGMRCCSKPRAKGMR
jgi:hypothetical protein